MKLEAESFITFYELFWLKILAIEFKKDKLDGAKTDFSPVIWEFKMGGHDEKMLALIKGKRNGKNVLYYHRIYLKCKLENAPADVDDASYCKALKYLGYRTDVDGFSDDVDIEKFDVRIMNALHEKFKTEHLNKLININDGVLVPASIQNLRENEDTAEKLVKARDIIGVKNVVTQYYHNLNSGHYRKAWDLMTTSFQEREWKSTATGEADFKMFAELHRLTRSISDIQIFQPKQISEDAMEVIVYYMDDVTTFPAEEFSDIKSLRIGQLNELVKRIKSFKKRYVAQGGASLDDVEIFRLFTPALSEHLRYKLNMDELLLRKLAREPKYIQTQRLCYVTCHRAGEQWLLHIIKETKAWPAR